MAKEKKQIVLPEALVVYPNLFTPRAFKPGAKPKYSASFVATAEVFKPAIELAKEAAMATWGSASGVKFPFKKGSEEAARLQGKGKDASHLDGMLILKTQSDFAPSVVNTKRQEIVDAKEVYSGIYGHGAISFVASEVSGNKYVTAYLGMFMKSKDGKRIQTSDPSSVFAGIGASSDVDPTEGLDIDL